MVEFLGPPFLREFDELKVIPSLVCEGINVESYVEVVIETNQCLIRRYFDLRALERNITHVMCYIILLPLFWRSNRQHLNSNISQNILKFLKIIWGTLSKIVNLLKMPIVPNAGHPMTFKFESFTWVSFILIHTVYKSRKWSDHLEVRFFWILMKISKTFF